MFLAIGRYLRKIPIAFIVAIILFIIPFFWYPRGAMDLGGDGTRLYFYDPGSFLKSFALYGIDPVGKGDINSAVHAYTIYVTFIALIKYLLKFSFLVINIFNGIKLSIGFLSIYFIIKELLWKNRTNDFFRTELTAIVTGIFYIVSTGSEKLVFFWVKALFSHDQVFLNPLVFLMLLKYFLTRNKWYLFGFLFISFIFSTNFAMIASPAFFAFYPLSLLFLFLYTVLIRKKRIFFKDILIIVLFFLGLQSFHLIPEFMFLFDKSSNVNSIVFKETVSGGVNFFTAIQGEGKASMSFFLPSSTGFGHWISFIPILTVCVGFLLQKERSPMKKLISLTSIFFFITFFFVTANITNIGLELYKRLFYIPGFSMFRHFFVQWAFVFIFFYSLLFGESLFTLFLRLKPKYIKVFSTLSILTFVFGFWNFLSGKNIDAVQWGSNNVRTAIIMDPRYEKVLQVIRNLPEDGKILVFPLTDNFNQVVYGLNNAAYVGSTSVSFLTSKKSFVGYQHFYPNPIPEEILRFAREKNYEGLTRIFSAFNIRYVFYNSDPKIYEEKFPQFPNSYMMSSLPNRQRGYKEFIKHFPLHLIYQNGPYYIYEFDQNVYNSEIYVPNSLKVGDVANINQSDLITFRSALVSKSMCNEKTIKNFCDFRYVSPTVVLRSSMIDPTRYIINVHQLEVYKPYILVFQNSFSRNWNLLLNGSNIITENSHFLVNNYANAWIITPHDHQEKKDYRITLELRSQRYFTYGLLISDISCIALIIYFAVLAYEKIR